MDLRSSTNIVSYAQSKDILRQAENELIKFKTGIYKNEGKRLRKLLLTLCRIELKCPTLKKQCDKLLDQILSEILNLRNNRLSIEVDVDTQPNISLPSSSLPLNCVAQTSRQSPICNEGECSHYINDQEKSLENVQPLSELLNETYSLDHNERMDTATAGSQNLNVQENQLENVEPLSAPTNTLEDNEKMSIAGSQNVNDQENVEQPSDSFEDLEKMSIAGSQSVFIDYNMSQIHATYFSNENLPDFNTEISDCPDASKECSIQAQGPIIDSVINVNWPKTSEKSKTSDNCTQVESNNELCLYNPASASSSNSADYLQFTEEEVTRLSQRLNVDEIDFYQLIYEVREETGTTDHLEQQVIGNISPQQNSVLEELLVEFVDESFH